MTQSHSEHPIVTCGCCARSFEGFAPEQAAGCAADVNKTGITGHYGSAVADMSHFRFKAGSPPADLRINTQICDACIETFLAEGVLDPNPDDLPAFGDLPPLDLSELNLVVLDDPATQSGGPQ